MIKPNNEIKNNKDIHIPDKKIKKKYIIECFGYGEINIKLIEDTSAPVSK